ncbi:MAG: hypothetical protein EOR26_32280 [Mesorhizobium sp.]|nr:MAG: hypothetical protein EOQ70_33145 [Mesorhizobium sp.]RWI41196.1 MAG: hypothetical protein EOR15_32855 [Mesorhizobium sp.]RWJ20695.1 MAG: hypothetical protein EOR26_32280 [Mesorhizobium sp.]RWJ83367.1 MAG: hypothetical protein EOR37_32250 [Mesorhizobium sp.]RWK12438.1 MAG: hypothetical protein EOR41_33110 [Mesorhizobium sp.]
MKVGSSDDNPSFHLHFTPTSASWLNTVEPFFAEIMRKRDLGSNVSLNLARGRLGIPECPHVDRKVVWTKSAGEVLELPPGPHEC